jgi:hypothetical protein
VHFTPALELRNEYWHYVDNVHTVTPMETPLTASKNSDVLSEVLQVRFP